MIIKLKNPKTESYVILKEVILGDQFPWFFNSRSIENMSYDERLYSNLPFYSHKVLSAPGTTEKYYSHVNSGYIDLFHQLFLDIALKNNIEPMVIYRINVNLVHPTESVKHSVPHTDHNFPHKNIIVYLTNPNGGNIICEGESVSLDEDDIVLLEGKHYIKSPSHGRRISLIYTFLDKEMSDRCSTEMELLK